MMAQTLQMTLMNHKIENISENIGWVLFELGCSNLYKVRHKMIPSMLLRLLQGQRRIYFVVYCGNKICSLSVSLWAAHQVWPSPCTYLFKIQDIWFITERDWKRVLPWQYLDGCHFVSHLMYITSAKIEYHYSNNLGDILNFVIHYSHLRNN